MPSETERYYDKRAAEYDRVYDKPERQHDIARLRTRIADTLAGRRVLELAAGTGFWTQHYAAGAAAVCATDLNASTLEVARHRCAWPAHTDFRTADAFALGAIVGDFDAVFAGFLWSHIPLDRLDRFLTGIAERMPAGSVVLFADNNYVEGSNHPIARIDERGNTYQRRTLSDGTEWDVLKNFPEPEWLGTYLQPFGGDVMVELLEFFWTARLVLR